MVTQGTNSVQGAGGPSPYEVGRRKEEKRFTTDVQAAGRNSGDSLSGVDQINILLDGNGKVSRVTLIGENVALPDQAPAAKILSRLQGKQYVAFAQQKISLNVVKNRERLTLTLSSREAFSQLKAKMKEAAFYEARETPGSQPSMELIYGPDKNGKAEVKKLTISAKSPQAQQIMNEEGHALAKRFPKDTRGTIKVLTFQDVDPTKRKLQELDQKVQAAQTAQEYRLAMTNYDRFVAMMPGLNMDTKEAQATYLPKEETQMEMVKRVVNGPEMDLSNVALPKAVRVPDEKPQVAGDQTTP